MESPPGRLCEHGGGRSDRVDEPEPSAPPPLPLLSPSAARSLAGAAASTAAQGKKPIPFRYVKLAGPARQGSVIKPVFPENN